MTYHVYLTNGIRIQVDAPNAPAASYAAMQQGFKPDRAVPANERKA